MRYYTTPRAYQAAARRLVRTEENRRRELERLRREEQKLTALEAARLEVEAYENRLAVLLSVHKEQGETWNWYKIASDLPPFPPRREGTRAYTVIRDSISPGRLAEAELAGLMEKAMQEDETAFLKAQAEYSESITEWKKMNVLALKVIAGDPQAYLEVIREFSPFAEISDLGTSVVFSGVDEKVIGGVLHVNGPRVIPAEAKTLTASGKVSIKAMAKGRFHEIYQDYLCGCVLRVAREVFAMIPVEWVILSAQVVSLESSTGREGEQSVLSVAFSRRRMEELDFERLDPSDTVEGFLHRCDFKATRKSEAFQSIEPLRVGDLVGERSGLCVEELREAVRQLRREVQETLDDLTSDTPAGTT